MSVTGWLDGHAFGAPLLADPAAAWAALALAGPLAAAAMVTDLRRMRIPNALNAVLALLFLPWAAACLPLHAAAWSLALGALTLAAGFALFATGRMGGGDVKMLAAGALWVGPSGGAQALLLLSAALLAGLALVHGARLALAAGPGGPPAWRGLRRGARFPMGVSIGAALIAHLLLTALAAA